MKKIIYSLLSVFIFITIFSFTNDVSAQNVGSLKSVVPAGFAFTMDLKPGYTDYQVLQLQKVLNADVDTTVSLEGEGSRGKETKYFGDKTKQAVIKFQNKYKDVILAPYGLTQGDGIVNKQTRTKLNLLIGVMNTYNSTGYPESTGTVSAPTTPTTTYVPPPTTVITSTTAPAMTTCQFVEFLIDINVILSAQANLARSALGCPTKNTTNTQVYAYNDPEPSLDMYANGNSGTYTISTPANVTISWNSKNVSSCKSDTGTSKSLSGSQTGLVSTTTTFKITCKGDYGSVSDQVTVKVSNSATSTVPLVVSCKAIPETQNINLPITWFAEIKSGGMNSYTYSWSGTGSLSGTGSSVTKSYSTVGTATTTLKVTSNGLTATSTCYAKIVNYSAVSATSTATLTATSSVAKSSRYVGYGMVNTWSMTDPVALATALKNAGLNLTQIEYLGGSYSTSAEAALRPKLVTFVNAMRAKGITTMISVVNMNASYANTITVANVSGILDFLATTTASATTTLGTNGVILEPLSGDLDLSVSTNVTAVNTKWNPIAAYAQKVWKGDLSYTILNSGEGAPSNFNSTVLANGFRVADYALKSLTDEPQNTLASGQVTMVSSSNAKLRAELDSGNAYASVFNPTNVAAWACYNLKKGYSLSAYSTHTTIDTGTINAIGQVLKKGSSCTEDALIEELLAKEEEEGAGPERYFDFAGVVTEVGACNNGTMKLWKVEVAPCRAGDQVSTQQTTGISSSVPGHIVIRDGYQKVPSVGSAIWGTAVDDMGLTCSNAGSEYIGTVTGGLEIDENAAAGCDAAKNTTQAAAGSNGSDGTDWVKVGTTAVLAPIVVPTKVVIEGVEAVGNLFGGW